MIIMFFKKYEKIFNNNNISLLLYNMNRNIKYKQVCRLILNGTNDLLKSSTSSQYSCTNSTITNSKIMRFTLNNSLNDVKLSQNARCMLEACHIPNITKIKNVIKNLFRLINGNFSCFKIIFITTSARIISVRSP